MKRAMTKLLATLIGLSLIGTAIIAAAPTKKDTTYGASLCRQPGFHCKKIRAGQTWDNLFKSRHERELVKRINRTNMPLHTFSVIAIPDNLKQLSLMSIAPFKTQYDTNGHRTILINLSKQAFAAYNKDGHLAHWGPISGGKDYCKDTGKACKTITGDFKITRKDGSECRSSQFPVSTRGGAPMPYCMHFYRGYAIHGSTLPGQHASHGCVRLFYDDAKWLNEKFAKIGTRVIITGGH